MPLQRSAFYGLALFTAGLQTIFGLIAASINGRSPHLSIFGYIAAGVSILTWAWIGTLMRFNGRPFSTSILTRASVHFFSFVSATVIWLALGIMLATQAPFECQVRTLWCAAASFSSVLAFMTFFFSSISALLIHLGVQKHGAGLGVNVAEINRTIRDDA
ncbi:hypothetical protein BDQ12DRAFT_692528 [Crucibulum laeve]|uniref:MARVEL domain-containing protein n=1 Tax=Crucibulum laeve TaxID=68775 RepID=A0A5C3LJH3_9AGAR|nr:hypothetical protein BDQ12DRAFT_692528 [Crucibulum laeve]